MVARIIIRLIEASIIPALLVFSTKFLSMILLSSFFGSPLELSRQGILFGRLEDFYWINFYSNVVVFLLVFSALFFTLVRNYFFSEAALSPRWATRLLRVNLEFLVVPLPRGYLKTAVWLIFAFFMTLSFYLQSFLGFNPFTLSALSLALLILCLFFLLLTLERDFKDVDLGGEVNLLIKEN